ncbi:hypothetical protein DPEC_G00069170 [Dallia pectoralis]|uniref:Uncharacterized protein n=1 Tax=Dallia pectoralis TaxID=75939 RepID=A0ACC2H2L9_DALPE|nr:hypothetical protein DPEC_G00069170 [Dallia pectoralis]
MVRPWLTLVLSLPSTILCFQASRGQSADLILVDEVGFVNSKVLLAVLPNIAFRGRKQVHITSHVNNTPWLNKVGGHPRGRRGARVPRSVAELQVQELMNMVTPKAFESEVTGSSSTASADTKSDDTTPFEPWVINKFLSNNSVPLEYMGRAAVVRAYLCLDPTFGGGSRSCAGVCCAVEFADGNLVVSHHGVGRVEGCHQKFTKQVAVIHGLVCFAA